MELQKILVYDKQNYFFRFLKYEFDKIFDFKKVKNDEIINDLGGYAIVVFVIYSESELLDFLKVYSNGCQVLVCTYNKEMLSKMQSLDDIILLDISKTKYEMTKELRNFFNCLTFQS